MWARNLEFTLALWLAVSPFVFHHGAEDTALWINDFTCATLIALFALASYAKPLRRAHLAELPVVAWLLGYGWTVSALHEATPAAQNHLVVGMLLGMLAIIPSAASRPPLGWRRDTDEGA